MALKSLRSISRTKTGATLQVFQSGNANKGDKEKSRQDSKLAGMLDFLFCETTRSRLPVSESQAAMSDLRREQKMDNAQRYQVM